MNIFEQLKTHRVIGKNKQKMFIGLKIMNKFLINQIFAFLNGSKEGRSILLITVLIDMSMKEEEISQLFMQSVHIQA